MHTSGRPGVTLLFQPVGSCHAFFSRVRRQDSTGAQIWWNKRSLFYFLLFPNSKENISTWFFWFYWSALFCSSPTLLPVGCFSSSEAAHSGCKFRAARRMTVSGVVICSSCLSRSTELKSHKNRLLLPSCNSTASLHLSSLSLTGRGWTGVLLKCSGGRDACGSTSNQRGGQGGWTGNVALL